MRGVPSRVIRYFQSIPRLVVWGSGLALEDRGGPG